MSKKRDDYILKLAETILDRREDEEARRLAERIRVPKVKQSSLVYWSAYLDGATDVAHKLIENYCQSNATGDDKVYRKAEFDLIRKDRRSMELYMFGNYEIRYRNHEHDKNGKLIRCEAYFVRQIEEFVEVK